MKEINVLSLFDGMSCGQIALNRAGIRYKNYFASEIDRHAITVTKHNYPKTVHIGDVAKVKSETLPEIDLLIGGSPCQGFSFAGKKLNFEDFRSKLFFEYVRLLKELKPKYFLLENVRMNKQSCDVISSILGVEPVMINSNLVSAHHRPRLYWTNINFPVPEDRNITLKDILEETSVPSLVLKGKGLNKLNRPRNRVTDIRTENKSPCLLASQYCKPTDAVIFFDGECYRYPSRTEMERLQTVPEGYTCAVKYNDAAKMLGNGWTVDVISHILSHADFS